MVNAKVSSFRGPAPLHHALLAGDTHTGISLQTLDSKNFDHGVVLAQSPYPGLPIPNSDTCTPEQLLRYLAPEGGRMLVQGIQEKLFVEPLMDVGWYDGQHGAKLRHAPRITPEHGKIRWGEWSATGLARAQRVLGKLWSIGTCHLKGEEKKKISKRIVFTNLRPVELPTPTNGAAQEPGRPFQIRGGLPKTTPGSLYVWTKDRECICIDEFKVEGDRIRKAVDAAVKAGLMDRDGECFHDPLH